jgi:hypothetical protein
MAGYRETSWLSIMMAADPEFQAKRRKVVEYEFSAPGGRVASGGDGTEEEQQLNHGKRIFIGDYTRRGPYREE